MENRVVMPLMVFAVLFFAAGLCLGRHPEATTTRGKKQQGEPGWSAPIRASAQTGY